MGANEVDNQAQSVIYEYKIEKMRIYLDMIRDCQPTSPEYRLATDQLRKYILIYKFKERKNKKESK